MARHGEIESNRARRYAGVSNEGLTKTGREQATILANTLVDKQLDYICTSSISRAKETAELIAAILGLPLVEDHRLNEMKLGPWEGLTEVEIARRYPGEYRLWMERPDELRLAGRESLGEVAQRVRAVVADAMASGRRELLITHVALIRVALLLSEHRPLGDYKKVNVANCQCYVVPEVFDGEPPTPSVHAETVAGRLSA